MKLANRLSLFEQVNNAKIVPRSSEEQLRPRVPRRARRNRRSLKRWWWAKQKWVAVVDEGVYIYTAALVRVEKKSSSTGTWRLVKSTIAFDDLDLRFPLRALTVVQCS
jgi:hypothetical protein